MRKNSPSKSPRRQQSSSTSDLHSTKNHQNLISQEEHKNF